MKIYTHKYLLHKNVPIKHMIGVLFAEVKPKCRSQSKKSKYFFESIGSNCIRTYLYMLNRYGIGKRNKRAFSYTLQKCFKSPILRDTEHFILRVWLNFT